MGTPEPWRHLVLCPVRQGAKELPGDTTHPEPRTGSRAVGSQAGAPHTPLTRPATTVSL